MIDYRKMLFETYGSSHADYVDSDDAAMLEALARYFAANYSEHLIHLDRETASILDIGCSKGYILAALKSAGFKSVHGVDLSHEDVRRARVLVPEAAVVLGDAGAYLEKHGEEFEAVLMKAVLEHIPKETLLSLLDRVYGALKPGGLTIVSVPNMDWLFGAHERYMDFTHEAGFTPESLSQVMRNVFDEVIVVRGSIGWSHDLKDIVKRLLRPVVISFVNGLLVLVDEGASKVWWHNRSIIGVGKKSEVARLG